MPGGDRTGPMGNGPMTGKQAGFCAGGASPGAGNRFYRRRRNRGGRFDGGMGPGLRRFQGGFEAANTAEESELLRQQAQRLESSLENIKQRLSQLEKNSEDK